MRRLPEWDTSVSEMLNHTAYMDVIPGDPSFRPALQKAPSRPYSTVVEIVYSSGENKSIVKASITPLNESATDWIYWIETDSTSGETNLDAPSAIIGRYRCPRMLTRSWLRKTAFLSGMMNIRLGKKSR